MLCDGQVELSHAQAVNSMAVERYLLLEMSDEEDSAFERHFFECRTCLDAVFAAHMFAHVLKKQVAC